MNESRDGVYSTSKELALGHSDNHDRTDKILNSMSKPVSRHILSVLAGVYPGGSPSIREARNGMACEYQCGSDAVVRFDSVSKRYGDVQALSEVSFEVNRGEVFCYIGPNGAGKTTTLKILVGLIRDFEGDVCVNGVSLRRGIADVHRMLGYVPQASAFQAWRTVRQALQSFGVLSGVPRHELAERIDEVLRTVALDDSADRKIPHLSGGMLQKLGLAQAILHRPQLLVMDEPMAGLDPASRFHFKQVIRELAAGGVTVLLSSHILSDVEDISDRIAVLNRGRIVRIATPAELQNEFRIGDIIEIQSPALSEEVIDRLSRLEVVSDVEKNGPSKCLIHLRPSSNIDEGCHSVLAALVAANCPLRVFRLAQPSLEEVYMRLVGGGDQ
ncbi:MAG: ABC transporter ATP-binding protein [Candidatus Thorarchaeota archaeon]|nr:ABC transporter ATP-binding protein [Candidatus Thorarchaeota archaeon]